MRKEGKAVAAGVTAQDNMHWASCPPVQLRRHASRPARRTKAKINILAKFVSEIIRKRGEKVFRLVANGGCFLKSASPSTAAPLLCSSTSHLISSR